MSITFPVRQAISPLHNCIIDNDPPVNGSWKVGDVSFYSRERLIHLLEIQPKHSLNIKESILGQHRSFATTEISGGMPDEHEQAYSKMRRATYILAAASLGTYSRHIPTGFGLIGSSFVSSKSVYVSDPDGGNFTLGIKNQGSVMPLELNAEWFRLLKDLKLDQLFERIDDSSLDLRWRRQISQGAAALGRSLMSPELADSFLWNVIALETLLTNRGERNGSKLTRRILGLTGWAFNTDLALYEKTIKDIHETRNKIVHDSDYDDLTPKLLIWSDHILINCLRIIVVNPIHFSSKQAMIDLIDGYANAKTWPTNGSPDLLWLENEVIENPGRIKLYPY